MITRRDLTPGFQACQAAHAALAFSVKHPEITKVWHTESNFLVILAVENEDELYDLLHDVKHLGITHVAFTEPDLDDEFTSLALEPSLDAQRLVANLPLALREEALV